MMERPQLVSILVQRWLVTTSHGGKNRAGTQGSGKLIDLAPNRVGSPVVAQSQSGAADWIELAITNWLR